ncbi:carotenoid 1,2-hydratase [Thiorhodospira sibirica]|uniref:carotenoid 1,2-hydratase n=1 Tax=Thiorhodospira sibirica TaxID=154347 RepID=UPI00022C1D23|nr:carotenoid 1,2-hydratase [Thiorhodospira sibirica]
MDAFSEDHRFGIILIAMLGSVFSPYYARSRARGELDPLNHCALNVALYGPNGKRWALTDRGRSSVERGRDFLRIGPSQLCWQDGALLIDINEVTVPVPSKIRGQVRVYPQAFNPQSFSLDAAQRHHWRPVAPCARVEVALNSPELHWSGPGYLDSNWGDESIEQGFTRWDWSRAELKDGTAILYDITRRNGEAFALALKYHPDSGLTQLPPPPAHPLPSGPIWRAGRNMQADEGHQPRIAKTFEDTPFYARSMVHSQLFGEPVTAMHESLDLDRYSKKWVRSLMPFRMPRVE